MTEGLAFFVAGDPISKGSVRCLCKNGHGVLASGSGESQRKRLRQWSAAVRGAAASVMEDRPAYEGPLGVTLRFTLARPVSHRGRTWPVGRNTGDLDKLQRAALDALTGPMFADDSQVVAIGASKDYGPTPGLEVRIVPLPETEVGGPHAGVGWLALPKTTDTPLRLLP